jgi:PAS domain-containing protein
MKNDLTVRYNQTDEHIINNPRFKEIERQKNFYELLVNASSDGMLSVDMKGIITFINPAGMKI